MIIKLNQSNVEEFMEKNNVSIKYTPEDIKNAIGVETRSRVRVGSDDSESSGESDVESDVESDKVAIRFMGERAVGRKTDGARRRL